METSRHLQENSLKEFKKEITNQEVDAIDWCFANQIT